ncbi:hypothetical protein, partial [Mesorhizobium sp.]
MDVSDILDRLVAFPS